MLESCLLNNWKAELRTHLWVCSGNLKFSQGPCACDSSQSFALSNEWMRKYGLVNNSTLGPVLNFATLVFRKQC